MWPRNSDVGARQRPLILPKAAHVKRKTASRFSLNDGQQESSVDSSIADFVGGSVLLSMYGSILMSAEVVCDCFGGSATTAIVAVLNGFRAVHIDPNFIEEAKERFRKETGIDVE